MKVEDEFGVEFYVRGGDPGNKMVLALKARRFGWVVLPRVALVTGVLPEAVPFLDDVLRAARLEECVAVLKEIA